MLTVTFVSSLVGSARSVSIIGALIVLSSAPLGANADDLIELSLQELLNVDVTSVSRRSQSLSTAGGSSGRYAVKL